MHTNNDNNLWLWIAARSSVVACVMPIGRRLLIVKRWILHEQKHTVQVSINIHCDLPCAYWLAHWRNHDHTILAEITGDPLILVGLITLRLAPITFLNTCTNWRLLILGTLGQHMQNGKLQLAFVLQ